MKKILALLVSFAAFLGCNGQAAYKSVDVAAFAEAISNSNVQLVDARTASEYAEGHIPGAVNIPNESIGSTNLSQLPDQKQKLLVYCRSGNRSKQAAEKLAALGYLNVYEFGGINTWNGEIEK